MSHELDTCVLCPRLCRHACPVAASSGREAAVPTLIADVLQAWHHGRVPDDVARQAATLCSDCGRCQDACHLHRPLPKLIAQARHALLAPAPPEPLTPLEPGGAWVAVQTDARAWPAAWRARTGNACVVLHTRDHLGAAAHGGPHWEDHLTALRHTIGDRTVVVADGGAARVLDMAGLAYVWLDQQLGIDARSSCARGATECCGGVAWLAHAHPGDAERMGQRQAGKGPLADTRCAAHVRSLGHATLDVVDQLMGEGA